MGLSPPLSRRSRRAWGWRSEVEVEVGVQGSGRPAAPTRQQRELPRPGSAPSQPTIIPIRLGSAEALQSVPIWPQSHGLALDGSAMAESSVPSSRQICSPVAADPARFPALGYLVTRGPGLIPPAPGTPASKHLPPGAMRDPQAGSPSSSRRRLALASLTGRIDSRLPRRTTVSSSTLNCSRS